MTASKFHQLVELRNLDHQKTYQYLDRVFAVISELKKQFIVYLGCENKNVSFVGFPLENGTIEKEGNWRDLIKIDRDCFFAFRLKIMLHHANDRFAGFNLNNSGKNFFEIGLAPPSGLILGLGIRYKDETEYDVKILNSPKNPFEKIFTVNLEQENLFLDIFEFLYQDMKKAMELGLEGRIAQLKNDETERQLGFAVPII